MPELATFIDANRPDHLQDAIKLLDAVRRENVEYFPSPIDWRDEILYFLLPDRFSDGHEDQRPALTLDQIHKFRTDPDRTGWNWQQWAESGRHWQGGTIQGIQSKLDYLHELGITTLWVGPIFKQRTRVDSYHGYGIQDFLEVDPRFGTRQELLELVKAAHQRGLRIILDIIMNHSGDNWGYVAPQQSLDKAFNEPAYLQWPKFYGDSADAALSGWQLAWRDEEQTGFTTGVATIQQPNDGVWPQELQNPAFYTRAGRGELGNGDISDEHAEHKRTDFFALKDFAVDVAPTLAFLTDCFKYWMAISDCDGFRIDTVKHVSLDEARNFCGAIREFAESLGKRNFLLVGEIAGGESAQTFYLDGLAILQRNLSAALDIGEARLELRDVSKGLQKANRYLDSFHNDPHGVGSHRNWGNRLVSVVDDHDHVFGNKLRFSAEIPEHLAAKDYQIVAATALQLFSLGIPCIYYGSEQAFSGPAHSQLSFLAAEGWNDSKNFGDRYLREAMFGPEHPRADYHNDLPTQLAQVDESLPGFGPFGTAGSHCFNPTSPAYIRIRALCRVRAQFLILRVGRQYAREIRLPDTDFVFPAAGQLIAWSRLLDNQEAICIVNPNGEATRGGQVLVSPELSPPGTRFVVVVNTAQVAAGSNYNGTHPADSILVVQRDNVNEPAYIDIRDVPPAEVIILLKKL